MKAVLGLVAGIIVAVLVMIAVGYMGDIVFPISGTVDLAQTDATLQTLNAASVGAQVFVLLSWFGAAFFGAITAKKISGVSWPGWTIAGVLALMLAAAFLVPLPIWMQILAVLGPLIGGLLADVIVPKRVTEVGTEEIGADAREPAADGEI